MVWLGDYAGGLRTLEMNARFWSLPGHFLEGSPSDCFVGLLFGVGLADGQAVGAGPGTGVFDVVVSGHVFCDDRYVVAMVSR